ncbi:SDR family NAD(P)-dependent oxidoreductase [Microbulbifer elongatus]|uniref:SDR family NAD(P)-dependent oxidoreductase n=1 Tax=Microbulbifer elongatus TaxID=86173 RepID=A0ABT1P2D4_9GAMM|nr:SDR family NAD(P)-dependent oxidoreductase [Microbulbifer elongatus]
MAKTWVITGASRGIGKSIVKSALSVGDNVVATGRSVDGLINAFGEEHSQLTFANLDVNDQDAAIRAVEIATERYGGIDVLVNNAGYGQLGHFETIRAEDIERQFETNVMGLMKVTRAVLPIMRKQKSGHIINLSSIGGAVGFEGASVYCATKFAVEGFSESLALEVNAFGIKVTIVEPGFFRTDFLDASSVRYGTIDIGDYASATKTQQTQYDQYSHAQPGDPEKLSALIVGVGHANSVPLRLIAGSDALEMSRASLQSRAAEMDAWAEKSITTDFEPA